MPRVAVGVTPAWTLSMDRGVARGQHSYSLAANVAALSSLAVLAVAIAVSAVAVVARGPVDFTAAVIPTAPVTIPSPATTLLPLPQETTDFPGPPRNERLRGPYLPSFTTPTSWAGASR